MVISQEKQTKTILPKSGYKAIVLKNDFTVLFYEKIKIAMAEKFEYTCVAKLKR